MRIGVFRAAADGRRTAARLTALGHEALLAPVLSIVATGATVKAASAEALVFTSAQAPEALAGHPAGLAHLVDLPCWCVGARTAAAARSAGFTRTRTGGGDAARLAGAIAAEKHPMRLALVVGRDRKPDLETGLARAGLVFDIVEAYAAEAVSSWPDQTVASLAGMTGALHYSRRSAALAFRLAEVAGLGHSFRTSAHYCLSEDVRSEVRHYGLTRLATAKRPDEDSLLALLEEA